MKPTASVYYYFVFFFKFNLQKVNNRTRKQ